MSSLLNWLRRRSLERGLDRELQYHIDRRMSELIASGFGEPEARRQATLELGGLSQVREEVIDIWLSRWLRDFFYDIRFSVRSFLRSPSLTVTIVLSLAIGIGATAAIYSLVDQVLLHSLPIYKPERLVLIDWKGDQLASGFGTWNLMSYPISRDLQSQDQFFQGVLARAETTVNLSTGAEPAPVAAEIVSGSYFSVLGVGAVVGRVLTDEDDRTPGASPVVVLAYDFWKTRLGGAPDVLGRKVLVNQRPMTVVGVASPGFRGIDVGAVPVLWIPASMSAEAIPGFTDLLDRRTRWMQILGRLRDGVKLNQAQAGLQPWFKAMLEEDTRRPGFPVVTEDRLRQFLTSTIELTPAPQGHSFLRVLVSEPLWVLFAAAAALLGLACLNVAGLYLARGSARAREISTRLALGASRGRIGRQLLVDSVLLGLAGGLLGVALAPIAMHTLIAFLPRVTAATALHSGVDSRLLVFALLASMTAGVLSGIVPALHLGRQSLISYLGDRSGASSAGVLLRKVIVTVQIAFSLVLAIGAVSFVRTLSALLARGPGFETSRLVSFSLDPRLNGYSTAESSRLIRQIYDAVRDSPVAESSAVARFTLLTGGSWNNEMTIQTDQRITTDREVDLNAVSPEFFTVLGARILAGRNFDEHDYRPASDPGYRSAIVNETFVKRYLAGRNPLGVRIGQGAGPGAKPNIEIVGVVTDFGYRDLRDESEQAFFPIFEGGDYVGTFYLRVRCTPEEALQSIRAIVHNADPALPVNQFRMLDEQVSRSLNTERMLAVLSSTFGGTALLLSLVGLYGVMSFVMTRRTREIGIRIALGASKFRAVWLILRDALLMVVAGVAIALPCVGALERLIESQLFGVKATDPSTMIQAILLLGSAALAAALIPALRAAAVNPSDALRLD